MFAELSPDDKAKYVAAKRAVNFVEDGMKLGLGTGSTAAWMVRCLAERVHKEGLRIKGVPTSSRTANLARELGLEVITLDEAGRLDITIDGTDEFDANLNLIKGGGGALLQEKIVASASDKMIVIADFGKRVTYLGQFPLPIEVLPMAKSYVARELTKLGGQPQLRDFKTDNGNLILDVHELKIIDPIEMETKINQIVGVVTNGLFAVRPANILLLATNEGVKTIKKGA
mgnify:CR=1 FL=1